MPQTGNRAALVASHTHTTLIILPLAIPPSARSRSVLPGDATAGTAASPGSPTPPMERPLKAGWLKKQQRSLVKNWQQRYFVLRGSTLTYHKDDKETAIQGVVQLRFSKVQELPPNTDDFSRFLFQIIPRSKGDRERCSLVLMANSQSDMDEWLRMLRRAIGAPSSGVFGRSLGDLLASDQQSGPHLVPVLVKKCAEFIQERGLREEGIFRLPGQDNAVRMFRDAFDAGERPSFPSDTDVHTVASLLKLYLRELPEPVIPWSQYQNFLDCTQTLDCPGQPGWEKLDRQISLLPRVNYSLLSYICRFLFEVQLHSKVNKMNVENLATVMGINLLKPQIEDPITVMRATPQIQKLMTMLIGHHEVLFPSSKDQLPSPPPDKSESHKNSPRSFVGWESTEHCNTSLSESPEEEEDQDSPGPLRLNTPAPVSPLDHEAMEVPRKRTQTLPVFSCPLTGMAAKAGALNRWSRIQESLEDRNVTFSEDIFKILDLKTSGLLFQTNTIRDIEEEVKRRPGTCGEQDGITLIEAGKEPNNCVQPPVQSPTHSKSNGRHADTIQGANNGEDKRSPAELIDCLQKENAELRVTVAELRSELETERRCVVALKKCLKQAS
ncbi:unnamed protein product [Knipowitschia caucasica]